MSLGNYSRAMRLPFLSASVLPYIFGSLVADVYFDPLYFILGLIAVSSMHISANLINDYADSRSGADEQDPTYYGFFGGSKLIQQGVLRPEFYRNLALFFAVLALLSVAAITMLNAQVLTLILFLLVLALAWAYSHGPFQLAYNRLGELTIFLLFGPAVVYGGAFIQQGGWPRIEVLLLSVPFGLLTTAILVSNEIPDYHQDKSVKKNNLVGLVGAEKSYGLYALLVVLAFMVVAAIFLSGMCGYAALGAFLAVPVACKATKILRADWRERDKLVESSKLTILLQTLVSLALLAGVYI